MDRLQNPYQPGAGTRPPALIGRDDLIEGFGVTLRRTLSGRSGKSCMLVGLRGVGKTVLLNRFAEVAGAEGVKVGFMEAPENGDFRTLLAVRLRGILLEWNSRLLRAVTRALGVLKSFTLKLPAGASISIGVDPLAGRADSGLLAEDLTDVLVAAGEAAAACDSALMVAVDEVQYLSTDELAALVTAIHRTTQLGLPVILTGAGLPQLPALVGAARSYAERLFEFPVVSSLPPAEAAAAIVVPAREFGVEFTSPAVDRVVTESGGYPYFLQEWGYHVWNAAPSTPIADDDVRAARSSVIGTLDRDFFRVRFDRLTPKEKDYLRAMAVLGPGGHRSGDIAAALGVRVESVAPRRSGLIAKGMIYSPAHGDTAFTVPLFDQFLLRALPGR
ncbi:MAG: ATP-binding protein [Acidobacteria bacterium]|nr:ATP-binding protein [Acidobacteriota bacterium]